MKFTPTYPDHLLAPPVKNIQAAFNFYHDVILKNDFKQERPLRKIKDNERILWQIDPSRKYLTMGSCLINLG